MAKTTRIILTCDYHPDTEAAETMQYSIGGVLYEVDLCQACLDETLAASRKVSRYARPGAPRRHRRNGLDNTAVRAWARENGREVAARGRIPFSVIEEYRASG